MKRYPLILGLVLILSLSGAANAQIVLEPVDVSGVTIRIVAHPGHNDSIVALRDLPSDHQSERVPFDGPTKLFMVRFDTFPQLFESHISSLGLHEIGSQIESVRN